MTMPYYTARSGLSAREEITRILQHFGCQSVGFMDMFEERAVLLQFEHRGRQVQMKASAEGWAAAFLRESPWSSRMKRSETRYKEDALTQGMIAVNSILRDWVKGQITAIECGMFSFDHVFMPHMLAADGRPMVEHMRKALPAPEGEQV